MGLLRINRERRTRLLILVLVLLLMPGAWGLSTSHAERLAAPSFWEPEYDALRSPDPEVRAQAVKRLSVTEDPNAAQVLLLYLGDPDQKVGLYMAQTLGDLAEEDALAALRFALWDPNPNIRWRAAMALGNQRDAQAVPGLAGLLQDEEKLVQNVAANALAQIGTPQAVEALAAGLGSTEPSTVNNTMNGLQRLGSGALPALTSILKSGNPQARLNAATLLGYLADPQAVPALQQAGKDPDAEVRAEARWALEEITKTQKK
jgi:HEAT repeat protein